MLAGSASAATRAPPNPCARHGDSTACYVAHQATWLADFGLPTAESRLAAGDRIWRVMIYGRNLNPVVAIEYRRTAGSEPMVSLYAPREEGSPSLSEPGISATVPLSDWTRLGEAGRHFDRTMTPRPPQPPSDHIEMCFDAWTYVVEATDPSAEEPRLRRRVEDACESGLAIAFARELSDMAARIVPACTALELPTQSRMLETCARLRGDRLSAALAANQADHLQSPREADDISYVFADDARLTWDGQSVTGREPAVELWLRHANGDENGHFFLGQAAGDTANRVRIEGHVERWQSVPDQEGRLMIAPATLIFAFDPNLRTFRLSEATVGAYAPAAHYCDPTTLVRRCR